MYLIKCVETLTNDEGSSDFIQWISSDFCGKPFESFDRAKDRIIDILVDLWSKKGGTFSNTLTQSTVKYKDEFWGEYTVVYTVMEVVEVSN